LRSIQIFQRSGDDGNLTLRIPVGQPDVEYDVLVMLRPKKPKAADWPPGFLGDDESPTGADAPPSIRGGHGRN
jgi:hypothetical protein